jgi:hypothetical protein
MNARPDQFEHLTLEEKKAQLGWGFRIRQWLVSWLMNDVHLQRVHFGENTITLSPSGAADVARWSATGTLAQLGDMTVDQGSTGRLQFYDGTTTRSTAHTDEAIVESGANDFTANQSMGGNKLTNLANGTADSDAVNKGQLDAAVSGLSWQEPVAAKDYLGTRTIGEIDALSPSNGQTVVAGSAGTPAATGSATLAIGDVAEYQGASLGWQIIVANSGGFVPADTRLLIADETVTLFAPLSDGVDESDIATFDGTSNTPSSKTVSVDGWALLVNGEGSVNENTQWVHDTSPSVQWLQFGGTSTAHSSLTGLTTGDDHTQYALLAGRSGGQTLQGGNGGGGLALRGGDTASVNLTLESTSNGTKGEIQLASGSNTVMMGNDDFVPDTTGQGEIGTPTFKFLAVNALTVTSGDHNFVHSERGVAWTVTEFEDGLCLVNRKTGKWYKIGMAEIEPRCPDSELAPIADELAAIAAK